VKILLFGATGGIGSHIRERARANGHELVLFARDTAKLDPLHDGETAVAGDIADAVRVTAAVAGVDAVISALGPTSNGADQVPLFENFARALVEAMKAHGVRRLVAISGGAVEVPGERKRLAARLASAVVRLFVGNVVAAKQREFDIVHASDLDWVAPRAARVVHGPRTGTYNVGDAARGTRVNAGDLADFMVAALTDDSYLRQAPLIAN